MNIVISVTIDKFKTGMEIVKNVLTCLKDYKRDKIIYTFFTLNLLSNPPSPIGQLAKEILSRDEAVAKPFRIKSVC